MDNQLLSEDELKQLLRECYGRIPSSRLGQTRCVDVDPAGSTYEFIEYEWSKRIREILGYEHAPNG